MSAYRQGDVSKHNPLGYSAVENQEDLRRYPMGSFVSGNEFSAQTRPDQYKPRAGSLSGRSSSASKIGMGSRFAVKRASGIQQEFEGISGISQADIRERASEVSQVSGGFSNNSLAKPKNARDSFNYFTGERIDDSAMTQERGLALRMSEERPGQMNMNQNYIPRPDKYRQDKWADKQDDIKETF